jgi:hypothetical protein
MSDETLQSSNHDSLSSHNGNIYGTRRFHEQGLRIIAFFVIILVLLACLFAIICVRVSSDMFTWTLGMDANGDKSTTASGRNG